MKRLILSPPINQIEYYHFVSTERGNKYFKVDRFNNKVWAICLNGGRRKKGRPHFEGFYRLAMSSFNGTYFWYFGRKKTVNSDTQLKITTENQYLQAIDLIVQKFKNEKQN